MRSEEELSEECEYESEETENEAAPENTKLSYSRIVSKFMERERNWNKQEMLALIWVIRLFLALICGLFVGACQIPTIAGGLAFVFMCHKVPVGLIRNRVGVNPVKVINDPYKLVKYGTVTVYMLFLFCAISIRLFLGLQDMKARPSPANVQQ